VAPDYVMNNILLEEVKEIKDLGVFYDTLLVFDKHICEKINKKITFKFHAWQSIDAALGVPDIILCSQPPTYVRRLCLLSVYTGRSPISVCLPLAP